MAEIQEAKAVGGDTDQEIYWSQLAQEHWGKAAKSKKVRSEVIEKEIWDVLSAEDFAFRSLHQLETLLLLEKFDTSCSFQAGSDQSLAIFGQDLQTTLRIITSS